MPWRGLFIQPEYPVERARRARLQKTSLTVGADGGLAFSGVTDPGYNPIPFSVDADGGLAGSVL
jgi:hypothetical protein